MKSHRSKPSLSAEEIAAEVSGIERPLALFRESGHALGRYWERHPQPTRRRPAAKLPRAIAIVMAAAAFIFAIRSRVAPARPASRQEVFVRIPYVVPAAPYERTGIVRMDVPVAALVAAGFHMEAAAAGGSLPADVLIGQDGRALAVSLLNQTGDMNR